jgi:hypothetical protein
MTPPGARLRNRPLSKAVRSLAVVKTAKPLALVALVLASGCSSFRYEPVANWARDGGRLCALDRDPAFADERAAPRPCAQAFIRAEGWVPYPRVDRPG